MERTCDCDETLVRGVRVPPPKGHDCDYVRQRNALIVEAEKIADSESRDRKKSK